MQVYLDLILLKEDDKPYIGGEEIKGQIELSVKEPIKITRLSLRIFGEMQTSWSEKRTDNTFKSREFVLDEYIDLTSELFMHCNDPNEFLDGNHRFEFKTKLPLDVVSSIDRENFGFVRYTCMASLDVDGGDSIIVAERDFKVVSFLNLDAPYLKEPVKSNGEVNLLTRCFRKPKGTVRAEVQVAELGETVRVQIDFENTSKRRRFISKKTQKCVLLSLCQQLDFKSQSTVNPKSYGEKSLTIALHSQGTCKSAPGTGPETRFIEFDVPENLPPTTIRANGLITCSYFFRLNMNHFDVIVPIIVGSVKTFGSEVFH
ncbi:Arrestin-C domain-containing protein [Aphelenchoides bicaudatus]|nr:Arrestin-C domain-containing protein [Aphelenchoides bicaudatus]